MSQPTYIKIPEIRETKIEKLSFPTGLLSSLFSVVLPQRALTPSTATRRRKIPRELCLFSSLSTIPTASVAFLTRIMPCRGRGTGTAVLQEAVSGYDRVHVPSFLNTCSTTSARGLPFSVLSRLFQTYLS